MYFGFSPELNAAIDAGVAKYGPLELSKRFLFHYMRENGWLPLRRLLPSNACIRVVRIPTVVVPIIIG